MVCVPAGEFLFGLNSNRLLDMNISDSYEEALVYLPEFRIDRTPVTYKKYREFIVDTDYSPPIRDRRRCLDMRFRKYLWGLDKNYSDGLSDMPVVFVAWYDAYAYCEWSGMSLPTELEWEKAAQGVDGRSYPWGEDDDIDKFCNGSHRSASASRRELSSVISHPQGVSPYGCLDMMGNAREWCNDTYYNHHNSTSANYSASGHILTRYLKDPDGNDAYSVGRVMKGTGYSLPIAHVSDRYPEDPWECSPFNGFSL